MINCHKGNQSDKRCTKKNIELYNQRAGRDLSGHLGQIINLVPKDFDLFLKFHHEDIQLQCVFPFPPLCIISHLPVTSVMLPVCLEAGTVSPLTLMIRKPRLKEVPDSLYFLNMLTLWGILAFSGMRAGEETLRSKPQMERNCSVSPSLFAAWTP